MWDWGASFSILTQPGIAGYIGKGVVFTLEGQVDLERCQWEP